MDVRRRETINIEWKFFIDFLKRVIAVSITHERLSNNLFNGYVPDIESNVHAPKTQKIASAHVMKKDVLKSHEQGPTHEDQYQTETCCDGPPLPFVCSTQ